VPFVDRSVCTKQYVLSVSNVRRAQQALSPHLFLQLRVQPHLVGLLDRGAALCGCGACGRHGSHAEIHR
jgi:hypothetical protein